MARRVSQTTTVECICDYCKARVADQVLDARHPALPRADPEKFIPEGWRWLCLTSDIDGAAITDGVLWSLLCSHCFALVIELLDARRDGEA